MQKRVSLTIIATRPRQFAALFDEALRKNTIDSFGGLPADAVLLSGLDPVNLSDPSGQPGDGQQYALPPRVHAVTDGLLRDGDTVFEVLARNGTHYDPTLVADFYRNVWFDGLEANAGSHFIVSGSNVVPVAALPTAVSVTAKYVIAL